MGMPFGGGRKAFYGRKKEQKISGHDIRKLVVCNTAPTQTPV
jgi:hypothetical protein